MYVIGTQSKLTTAGGEAKITFGTPPKVHDSNYLAVQEACRLAQQHADKRFFVFRAVAEASVTPPPPPPVEVKEL